MKHVNKKKSYKGETARSGRLRGGEHLRDLKNKNPKSALYKHKEAEHKNEHMDIKMSISKGFKDALTRQTNEGVRIFRENKPTLMNSKSEMNHPKIPRILVDI